MQNNGGIEVYSRCVPTGLQNSKKKCWTSQSLKKCSTFHFPTDSFGNRFSYSLSNLRDCFIGNQESETNNMNRKFIFREITFCAFLFIQFFTVVFCFERKIESSLLNTLHVVNDVGRRDGNNDGVQNLFDEFQSEILGSINDSTILTKENTECKIHLELGNMAELDYRSLVKSTDLFQKSPQATVVQNVQLTQNFKLTMTNLDLSVFSLGKLLNMTVNMPQEPMTAVTHQLVVVTRKDLLIVLTTCNQLKMTIFALEYLRETHPEADLLVVDDHSVDGTVDYLIKKGYSVMAKGVAKGLTDSWNKGYEIAVALGYKYLIFTNNDVLVSAAGVRILKQELKREVLVVPLTSAKGAGHNPSQSLVSAYRLPEADEDYVDNYRHFELIQAALSRIARNTTGIANPQG